MFGMAATVVLKGVLTWLQRYYLLRYQTKLAITESGRYLGRLMQLPVHFFSQRMAGDLVRRVANNDRVADLLTGKLALAALSLITVFFYAALMAYFDMTLTVIAIFIALLNLIVLKSVSR